MSVLSTPRAVFRGFAWWNPGTANNVKTELYDRTTGAFAVMAELDDGAFHRHLIGLEEDRIRCGPNLYGDHSCGFVAGETSVTGGSLGPGRTCPPDDPVLGAGVQILAANGEPARIADVDPYAGWSSRLYVERLRIGGDGMPGLTIGGGEPTVFLHYDPARNYNGTGDLDAAGTGGALWQTTFRKEEAEWFAAAESPLLAVLRAAMEADSVLGLMIRFYTYRARYYQNGVHPTLFPGAPTPRGPAELAALYADGEVFPNPAVSLVVGAVGLWMRGEMATVPGGRYLRGVEAVRPRGLLRDGPPNPSRLGPVRVEVDDAGRRIVLDTLATFPEWDSSGGKADFGDVLVEAVAVDGRRRELVRLTPHDYGREGYEACAGIVERELSHAAGADLRSGVLAVTVKQPGYTAVEPMRRATALAEEELVVEAAVRGVYLEPDGCAEVELRLFERGDPVGLGVDVVVAQYESDHRPWSWTRTAAGEGGANGRSSGSAADLTYADVWALLDMLSGTRPTAPPPEAPPVEYVRMIETAAPAEGAGQRRLRLEASGSGCFNLLLLPYREGEPPPRPPGRFDTAAMLQLIKYAHFVTCRVLPAETEVEDAAAPAAAILRPYLLLNPGTIPGIERRRDPGGPDERRRFCDALAEASGRTLDDAGHFPPTRDLSVARRSKLAYWLARSRRPM